MDGIENTFESDDFEITTRQRNANFVKEDSECQQSINELKKIEKFLENLGFLTFGRDTVLGIFDTKTTSFSLNSLMSSLELTMGSVIACCESACIADANTLLRKYRDDLFFYLYISVYNSLEMNSEKAKTMAVQIERWINNDLSDFQIGQVLKAIAAIPQLRDTVAKYHLKETFQNIGNYLNNYVHGNGHSYYNRSYFPYKKNALAVKLKEIENNARYLTVVVMLLLIFCFPSLVMAEDYVGYLDMNLTPPENSQYWVASFVENFMKENISLIDKNCLDYLQENTMMQF